MDKKRPVTAGTKFQVRKELHRDITIYTIRKKLTVYLCGSPLL